MNELSLNELSGTETTTYTEQSLSQMVDIFSFSTADPSSFPQVQFQEFNQQIQHLPAGRIILFYTFTGESNVIILICP